MITLVKFVLVAIVLFVYYLLSEKVRRLFKAIAFTVIAIFAVIGEPIVLGMFTFSDSFYLVIIAGIEAVDAWKEAVVKPKNKRKKKSDL